MNQSAVTEMLARVFSDDPLFIYLFEPDIAGRRMHLIMRFLRELALRRGKVITQGENAEALLAYYAPGRFPVPFWRVLPLMVRMIPEALRSSVSVKKMLKSLSVLGAIEHFHPKEPHWYISMLAVAESARGKGLGGKILEPFFLQVDARHEAVYLESSNPKNHNFYQRNGFEIVREFHYSPDTPPIWCMVRRGR